MLRLPMKNKRIHSSVAIACALSFAACSDEAPPKRYYQEVVVQAPPSASMDPHAGMDTSAGMLAPPLTAAPPPAQGRSIMWEIPEGWVQQPGSGMRLATLVIQTEEETAECTLIILSGDVGGLDANIQRWMGQIGLPIPPAPEFRSYVNNLTRFETVGGHSALLIDFNPLVQDDAALSTLGGIIEVGPLTLFIKLTGSKRLLTAEYDRFVELCKSVR